MWQTTTVEFIINLKSEHFSEFKNLFMTGWLLSSNAHFCIETWRTNALLCDTCVIHSGAHHHCKLYISTEHCGVCRNTVCGTLNDWSLTFNTTAVLNPKNYVYLFYILLTVHLVAILDNNQLDALFLNMFISCLYKLRAASAHHQEDRILLIHHLV